MYNRRINIVNIEIIYRQLGNDVYMLFFYWFEFRFLHHLFSDKLYIRKLSVQSFKIRLDSNGQSRRATRIWRPNFVCLHCQFSDDLKIRNRLQFFRSRPSKVGGRTPRSVFLFYLLHFELWFFSSSRYYFNFWYFLKVTYERLQLLWRTPVQIQIHVECEYVRMFDFRKQETV